MSDRHPFSGDRFRRALRFFVFGRTVQAIASLAVTLLGVRLLAPSDYGTYLVLWGLLELLRPLVSLGLLPALQQFLPEMAIHGQPHQLRQLVRWSMAARAGLLLTWCGLLALFWLPLSALLGLPPLLGTKPWLLFGLVVVVLGAELVYDMLEALLDQRAAQSIRGLFPVLRLLGLLALAAAGPVALVPVLMLDLLAGALCLLLAEAAMLLRLRRMRPDGSRWFSRREVIGFAWQMTGTQVFNAVGSPGLARLVVAGLLGPVAAGQFGFLQQLVDQLKRFMPSLLMANLVRPMLVARRLAGDASGVSAAAGVLWKGNALVVWPLLVAMIVAGDPIVHLLGGSTLAAQGLAAACLLAGAAATAQNQLAGLLLQVHREAGRLRRVSASSLALPALVALGAWSGGTMGAAAGVAVGAWLRGSLAMLVLRRLQIRMTADASGLLRMAAGLALALAVALVLREWIGVVAALASAAMLVLACIFLARPLAPAEYELIQKLARGRASLLRCFVR